MPSGKAVTLAAGLLVGCVLGMDATSTSPTVRRHIERSSGVLFGPVLGTFVTLFSAIGTACIASLVGRRAGRDGARSLMGAERADRLDAQVQRRGLWAVVGQRFVPGISDALASYAFGAFGVPLWQMAVGAFIGSAPRAFVYTALGASIGDLSAPLAYTAIGVWCVTAVAGAFAALRDRFVGTDSARIEDVWPATCPISTAVAALAMPGML